MHGAGAGRQLRAQRLQRRDQGGAAALGRAGERGEVVGVRVARRRGGRRVPGLLVGGALGQAVITTGLTPADQSCGPEWAGATADTPRPATDSRPFLYLFGATIPSLYLVTIGLILAVSVAAVALVRAPFVADLFHAMGERLSKAGVWPTWSAASEFRAIRDRSAAERR